MLPPFGVESEETRAMARHSTVGIEPRVSSERIILLDTQVVYIVKIRCIFIVNGCVLEWVGNHSVICHLQPVFSPSVLAEMIRPDGSSTISVVSSESLSAELAHEMMSIQVTAFENLTTQSSKHILKSYKIIDRANVFLSVLQGLILAWRSACIHLSCYYRGIWGSSWC